jgi:CheY-like chemotaxis protein
MTSTLLVVEDNQADVWLVKEAIGRYNVPVELHVIQDGEQAIEFLGQVNTNQDSQCPGMVLLDLNLPKKSGREVLRFLRSTERCARTPVVVMTSSDSPKDRAEVSNLQAIYFRKPPDFEAFLEIGELVNQLLEKLESKGASSSAA